MQTNIVKAIQELEEKSNSQQQQLLAQQQQINQLTTLICLDHPDEEICNN